MLGNRFLNCLGLAVFFLVMVVGTCTAQTSAKTSLDEWAQDSLYLHRMGTGQDSIDCINRYYELWNKYISPHNKLAVELRSAGKDESLADSIYNDSTYIIWRRVMNQAPYCNYYFYTQGWLEHFLVYSMKKQNDKAVQLIYFQDLMNIEDALVNNQDTLNALRRNYSSLGDLPKNQSLADAQVKRAHYYYTVGKELFGNTKVYSPKQAYDYFKEAFQTVRADKNTGKSEIEGVYLSEYFGASYDLYKTDEDKYHDQFLTDYMDIKESCDHFLLPYWDVPDSIKNNTSDLRYRQYQGYSYWTYARKAAGNPDDGIIAQFENSGAAAPDKLNDYYESKLKDHRKDADFLNRAIHLMAENKADKTDAYFDYCETSYMLNPTYENCIGMAMSSSRDGMQDEMVKYFQEAKKLASTDLQRGLVAYQIGNAKNEPRPKDDKGVNYKSGTPEYEQWYKNESLAEGNYKEVIDLQDAFSSSSSIAVREIPAIAAYQIAMCEYRSAQRSSDCTTAIGWIDKSLAMRGNLSSVTINREGQRQNMVSGRKLYLDQEAKNRKSLNSKQNEMLNAKYQDYLRKKAAEEAFWRGKK